MPFCTTRAPQALAVAFLVGGLIACTAGSATAEPLPAVKSLAGGAVYNVDHAVFLLKDLGGGAYWNVTTSSLYVLETGSTTAVDTLVTAAVIGADLVATAADDGRDALLLLNGAVLVPVQQVLTGL